MARESWDLRGESPEFDAVAEYPPVSRLAVVSLVLAVLASGALFIPLLVCAAVAGAILAAAALWSIAHASSPVVGRKAALVALLLCILFGSWGTTWRWTRQQTLYAQAREHADTWLRLVQAGRLHDAYQLHLTQDSRLAPGADFEQHLAGNRDARLGFESLFQRDPVRQIVAAGKNGELRLVGFESQQDESYSGQQRDVVTLRYALDHRQDGQPQTMIFLMQLIRSVSHGDSEARWELRSVETPK